MAKFRKKPVVIEAMRMSGAFTVETREGTMTGQPGDWLLTGVQGEQYPCADDIFRQTYEAVDEEAEAMLLPPLSPEEQFAFCEQAREEGGE